MRRFAMARVGRQRITFAGTRIIIAAPWLNAPGPFGSIGAMLVAATTAGA